MKKISDLGITGKKLLFEGIGFLVVGMLLLIFGPNFPDLMLRLFLTFLWIRELWNFLFRWFANDSNPCCCVNRWKSLWFSRNDFLHTNFCRDLPFRERMGGET